MKRDTHKARLARSLERRLRDGRITLAQVMHLDEAERRALRAEADRLRKDGQATRASELLQMLVGFDPLDVETWRALSALEQRRGRHETALLCLEAVELLGEPNAEDIARRAACGAKNNQRQAFVSAAALQQGARR